MHKGHSWGYQNSVILHTQNFAQNWPSYAALAVVRRINKTVQKL